MRFFWPSARMVDARWTTRAPASRPATTRTHPSPSGTDLTSREATVCSQHRPATPRLAVLGKNGRSRHPRPLRGTPEWCRHGVPAETLRESRGDADASASGHGVGLGAISRTLPSALIDGSSLQRHGERHADPQLTRQMSAMSITARECPDAMVTMVCPGDTTLADLGSDQVRRSEIGSQLC